MKISYIDDYDFQQTYILICDTGDMLIRCSKKELERVLLDLYKDKDVNSLFELHKNQSGKGLRKIQKGDKAKYPLQEIIEGKHPKYPTSKLKFRLIREALLEEKCCQCGMEEKRITDMTVPLLLDHKDGDVTNHVLDNLQLLCYNCYYLTVGNPIGKKHKKL